ncbi:nuclear fragile X mental retardation-interacting protein 1-domain-containing protein, partial [Crepidotus variabilis]
YYGSHYAQAYYGQASVASVPSVGGYCNPQMPTQNTSRPKTLPTYLMSSWYQGGNNRCTQPGCSFTGSQKSVETHMMDRHLIYPPGWAKRKQKSDWDTDPSLKGKPIPIQGTSVILDTPEVIDAWVAERKKRFPTSERVEDKKRKMEEAIARGQLDLSARPNKRQKLGEQQGSRRNNDGAGARRGRGGHHQQRGRGGRNMPQSGKPDTSLPQKPEEPLGAPPLPVLKQSPPSSTDLPGLKKADRDASSFSAHELSSNGDSDEGPEELSSKAPVEIANPQPPETRQVVAVDPVSEPLQPIKKQRGPAQPRPPPKNPFAARPDLLRNLLEPDIRITVSNLSQAIRFIVDNDFLRNVELKAGQAAQQHKIHVLDSQEMGS